MLSDYDVGAEAFKLKILELEINEVVEVQDDFTGLMKEEEQLIYAGPAGSTVIAALSAAYEAGAQKMKDNIIEDLKKHMLVWTLGHTPGSAAVRRVRALSLPKPST